MSRSSVMGRKWPQRCHLSQTLRPVNMSPPVAERTLQLGLVKDPELQLPGHLGHRVLTGGGRRAGAGEGQEDMHCGLPLGPQEAALLRLASTSCAQRRLLCL